ncbi:MAG: hypothetical protein K0S61_2149 [Anaerocolumna sp.]|jgi:GH18 family chitinase|nr:hypothetical protein [Anaerocolumna sp.]
MKRNKKFLGLVVVTMVMAVLIPYFSHVQAYEVQTSTQAAAATYPAWDSGKVYLSGDCVSYNGQDYRAKWWTQGDTPGSASVWEALTTNGTHPAWVSTKAYTSGETVTYNGQVYKAKWWTQGETPGIAAVWELVSANPPVENLQNGTYYLTNKGSGKVIDVADNSMADGGKIHQWTYSKGANQQFKVTLQTDGSYKIVASHSNKVLDVPNSSTDNSIQLQQWNDNGTNAQRWLITKSTDGYYKVVSKASGLAMDVRNSSTADGGVVQQYTDNGSDAQKWSFTVVTDPQEPEEPELPDGFKVVGYYPSWEPSKINTIQYNNLTHINYAFAIPTSDGTLLPLENASAATQIIQTAHQNGVKVLLAVGGWSYNGTPLEATFMSATTSQDKIVKFGNAIVAMAKQYGFDGVDIDWEHPRSDGSSKQQYEAFMVYLKSELKKSNMLLTAAVLSGVTPEGVIYWDSAAQTDTVINTVDWFNVMAYDGGDGNRHSTYDFAVLSANYWKNTRHMPAEKVVLGVPFYGRPSWASYSAILAANPNAYNTDISMINGMEAYYNGIPTIKAKTQWACDNVGGIMIWELSQDTTDTSKSLLNAIGNTVRDNFE